MKMLAAVAGKKKVDKISKKTFIIRKKYLTKNEKKKVKRIENRNKGVEKKKEKKKIFLEVMKNKLVSLKNFVFLFSFFRLFFLPHFTQCYKITVSVFLLFFFIRFFSFPPSCCLSSSPCFPSHSTYIY